jgi:hypothetical protein
VELVLLEGQTLREVLGERTLAAAAAVVELLHRILATHLLILVEAMVAQEL